MEIVLAEQGDLPEILELQKTCYLLEAKKYDLYDIPQLNQTLAEIQQQFLQQPFLKATVNNRIVGSVRAYQKNETCYIGRLIVHPDHQNKGIGTKLMKEIEALFKDANRFQLTTGHKSKKNLHLYHKLGYTTFKTEKLNQKLTLVHLEKHKTQVTKQQQ